MKSHLDTARYLHIVVEGSMPRKVKRVFFLVTPKEGWREPGKELAKRVSHLSSGGATISGRASLGTRSMCI